MPEGTSRLRVTLSAAHTDEQVDRLVAALAPLADPPSAPAAADGQLRGEGSRQRCRLSPAPGPTGW